MTQPPEQEPRDERDPFETPPPPLAGEPRPDAPQQPAALPQYQKPPRKFAPGAIVAGILSGLGGALLLVSTSYAALANVSYSASGDLEAALGLIAFGLPVAAVIVPGIMLVRHGSPKRRGWGMGLLLSIPIGLVVLPVLGFIACLVLWSGLGY